VSVEILSTSPAREPRRRIENGVVQEIHIEAHQPRGLVSNLYKGRVSRVLPGMQAAFVEIGLQAHRVPARCRHRRDVRRRYRRSAPPAGQGPPEDIRRL